MEPTAVPGRTGHPAGGGRRTYLSIHVGPNRRGVLREEFIDLVLPLTSTPDPWWVRAFDAAASFESSSRVFLSGVPTIEHNHIVWSVPRGDLLTAWSYLNACIDGANIAGRKRMHSQPSPDPAS